MTSRSEDFLKKAEISYAILDNRLVFPCPVHGGDNPNGACIFTDGQTSRGNWVCWTHGCDKTYGKNIVGLVRGFLERKNGRHCSFEEAVNFCLKFLNKELSEIKIEKVSSSVHEFNKIWEAFQNPEDTPDPRIDRSFITSTLDIPSPYFINRGYGEWVLKEFDVGDCYTEGKQMYMRAVSPVYSENGNYVGCAGRTMNENEKKFKWVNSKGFKTSYNLYGLWVAKPYIEKTNKVYLVEGQGDVWRMNEAGIKNTLGIFGADLSESQLSLLEKMPILDVVVLTDMDEAGRKAADRIVGKCGRRFNYSVPELPTKDVGEMTVEQIKERFSV